MSTLWCPTLNWPFSFPQRLEHSAVKVTPILTVPDHHIAPSVAVLAARGCIQVTSAGQARGERWRQVTNGGVSKGEARWRQVWHEVTPRRLLTPCDGFQLLPLRPFHVYDICTCVAPLTGGVTPLRHFSQNSCCLSDSPLRTHKCTWHWVLWTHTPHAS